MRSSYDAFRILIVSLAVSMISTAAMAAGYADTPWSLSVGGGYSPVVGGLNSTLSDGWNFTAGLGYKLNPHWGLDLDYMNNHLGVDGGVLSRYSALLGGASTDGDAGVWSVTLNPKWNFEITRALGGYITGGGGYYHVKAQITTPGLAFMPPYCDYYYGCWPGGIVPADKIIGERKDDTGGVNIGAGITFDITPGVQFYLESRYHYILIHGPDLQLFPLVAGFRFS